MIDRSRLLATSISMLALVLVPSSGFSQVTSADDICAPTADPCTITSTVTVQDGAELDFGSRELRITGNGSLDTLAGAVAIRCGSFVADTGASVALKVRGPNGAGGIDGGLLTLEASRFCSGNPQVACFSDSGCSFGTCSAHLCTGDPRLTCTSNASCASACINGICSGQPKRFCANDAACDFGVCDTGVTRCQTNLTRTCSADPECNDGVCDVGTGTVSINGRIRAEGQTPGAIFITAAGDISMSQNVTINATTSFEDGGVLEVESGTGSVTISGKLEATGGADGQGGDFSILAADDIAITGDINVNGGDFDGGFVEIDAGRDVTIGASILANSTTGGGIGGDIGIYGGRDVTLSGTESIEANGHTDSEFFCGEGGAIVVEATTGNLVVGAGVTAQSNGSQPDCAGDSIVLTAGGNLSVAGKLQSKAQGTAGAGGLVSMTAGGSLESLSTTIVDVTGGSGGGGMLEVDAGGDVDFGGFADAGATNGGAGSSIRLSSKNSAFVNGTLATSGVVPLGATNGTVEVHACHTEIENGGLIQNVGTRGENRLIGERQVVVAAGGQVLADGLTGKNTLSYRDAAHPPIVNGTVAPTAVTVLDETLNSCAICGNMQIEQGETCDDGNTADGDGCSADCQNEGCVADTPGYPGVSLCDDGSGCTIDLCDTDLSACTHTTSCDDGIACTDDSCGVTNECEHVANHGLCDDGNVCTSDFCNQTTGCINANNAEPCDDGVDCTGGDVCFAGSCSGDDLCSQCEGGTGAACGDGSVDAPEECDDCDNQWSAGQSCSGECLLLDCGDPDNTGSVTASDALFVLRVAVGTSTCDTCVCDVDASGGATPVSASDALRVLRRAVNIGGPLTCSACG